MRRACADVEATGAAFAIVGGLAVSARAEPRLTRDVDLAVAAETDREAEAVVRALSVRGYRIAAVVEHATSKRRATARLHAPDRRIVIDLLFASCGIEPAIVARAERLEILSGLRVPVARVGHLIAMKLLARDDRSRPQDLDDLRALLAVASAADRRLVDRAIRDITSSGFARGRDLPSSWRELRVQLRAR